MAMGWNPARTGSSGVFGKGQVGSGGSALNTSANPFDSSQGGSLGSWDVVGRALDKGNPFVGGRQRQDQTSADMSKSIAQEGQAESDVINTQTQQGQQYYGGVADTAGTYKANTAANTDAYVGGVADIKGRIDPKYQQLSDRAMNNASSAMSLPEAMDPNNSVSAGVRNLYNTTGQGQAQAYDQLGAQQNQAYSQLGAQQNAAYQQAAANRMRSGLADANVENTMGAESVGQYLGAAGMPIVGGQMQALLAQSQAPGSQTVANTQQQANLLYQQGLQAQMGLQQQGLSAQTSAQSTGLGLESAMQTQGIGAGISQSNATYGFGRQAQQDAGNALGQQGAFEEGINNETFGAKQGQAATDYSIDAGLAGLHYGLGQQIDQEKMGMIAQQYGGAQQVINNDANYNNSLNSGILGVGGSVLGTFVGGAAGRRAPAAQQQPAQSPAQAPASASYPQPPSTASYAGGYPGAGTYGNAGVGTYVQGNGPSSGFGLAGPEGGYVPGSSFPQGSPYGSPVSEQATRAARGF